MTTAKRLTTFGTLATLVFAPWFSAPADAQIYFSDDFENAAESEEKWEVLTGDWQVADGVYHQLGTADPWQASMVAADQWNNEWVEYTVEFKVRPLTEGDAPVNILFRARDPMPVVWADRNGPNAHFYRWIVNGWTNTESRPYIYNAGTATMLAQTPNSLVVGNWHHLRLVVTKTRFAGYVDDVQMFDVAHAAWTEGRVGIQAYSGMMDFDDVIIYGPEYTPPWRLKAKQPNPADGAVGVQTPLFSWKAGDTAVMHEIYLGKSPGLDANDLVGPRQPLTMYWHLPGLEPGVNYYWRVDEIEADMVTVHTGDVWTFITQALTAYLPDPADGATDVAPTPVLTWLPGQAAITHHLYFGDSFADVNDAAAGADKGELDEATFSPGALEPVTTYYWRVDETIAGDTLRPGPVWSFTTYLPVDDFESYTDDEGSRIYETWIDGYTNGLSGSTVGYIEAPFAEQTIVHGGSQSMPLDYNNVNSPFYSEAERQFDPVQDWTFNGVDTLVLYVRGKSGNGPAPLYVAVKDTSNRMATVIHPDSAVVGVAKWTEWRIPLGDFAGVNLAMVKKLTIGLGDKVAAKPGGAGLIFVDDIRITKPRAY